MITFRKILAASAGPLIRAYYTESAPEPDRDLRTEPGRHADAGGRLTSYYTGRDSRVHWRVDMPHAVAEALGIDPTKLPKDKELDRLFEGKRADTGEPWSRFARKNSALDFTFSPHKSIGLAVEFAENPAEAAMLWTAIDRANDATMRFIAGDLGWARKGAQGEEGAEPGAVGWCSFRHHQARPTLQVRDGKDGITYLAELPIPGDPQPHIHNPLWNVVVTDDGRLGSLDTQRLTDVRVLVYGAIGQAVLAEEIRRLGARVEVDASGRFAILSAIRQDAVDLFSKGRRQTIRNAKAYAKRQGLDWSSLSAERKYGLLHAATRDERQSKAARGGAKTEGRTDRQIWRDQAAGIGWSHRTVLEGAKPPPMTDAERFDAAYAFAAKHLAEEFRTAAVLDRDKLDLWVARGLIGAGMKSVHDVGRVVRLIEERGIDIHGERAALITGMVDGRVRVTNSAQLRIEERLADLALRASRDRSGALAPAAIKAAVGASGLRFDGDHGQAQLAAMYALGTGGACSYLTGVAGAGKSHLLKPLVAAYKADTRFDPAGREVIGVATGWVQADAMQDAKVDRTIALDPLLRSIEAGEFRPTRNTVIILEELSQIGPRSLLALMELQAETGFTLKGIGDREQCQAQPLDADVLTPSGFRKMGDLLVGDLVVTPDGRNCAITAISPQRIKEVYRVTFADGRQVECCDDHLWKVWKHKAVYSSGSHAIRKVINKGAGWAVLPLREIKQWFDKGFARASSAAVPLVDPFSIERPAKNLPIPPYALGLLLGDGHFAYGCVHYSTADKGLVDQLVDLLPAYEAVHVGRYDYRLKLRDLKAHTRGRNRTSPAVGLAPFKRNGGRREIMVECDGRKQTLSEWAKERGIGLQKLRRRLGVLGWSASQALEFDGRHINKSHSYSPLSLALADLGLCGTRSHDKFVPEAYKDGSVAQRLEILRGLFDTDGTVGEGGTYAVYYTTSPHLAQDVSSLARSLGAIVNIGKRQPKNPNARLQYYVQIRHDDIGQFFSLPRKLKMVRRRSTKLRLRIASIETAGMKLTQCIVVDHPDHLYVTNDYVVTHNSIEAGDSIEILNRRLPKEDRPELLSTVRQKRDRDKAIAGLFRDGEAAAALEMKREDGTVQMLGGDYDQVCGAIADHYVRRRDVLMASGIKRGITASALTNADAADISRAIRERLRERGEIAADERVYPAVDQRGERYALPIAEGDRLRLFRKTSARVDGRFGFIGSNGDVVTVEAVTDQGLTVRDKDGRRGEVEWRRLKAPGSDRLLLGFGWCQTVDAIQGVTSAEHINALPRGTSAMTKFKGYTAESRAEWSTWTMISEAAVFEAVRHKRALGDQSEITSAHLWKQAAEDMSRAPYKALAMDLVESLRDQEASAVDRFIAADQRIQAQEASGRRHSQEFRARLQADAVRRSLDARMDGFAAAMRRNAEALGPEAMVPNSHLQGLRKEAEVARVKVARGLAPGPS